MESTNINKRDYFAAHAPKEIPEWFEHIAAEAKWAYPEMDSADERAEEIRKWLNTIN